MFPWEAAYIQHLVEQKHTAFMRFVNSGYRDHSAWYEFIRLYDKLNKFNLRGFQPVLNQRNND